MRTSLSSLSTFGCLLLASTCLAQLPKWAQIKTQNTPTGRWSHGMQYDFIRGRIVIFGGTSATNNYMNDTWEYDGKDWKQMQPKTVPPGRRLTSMSYHLTRVKMLMFGGLSANGVLGDTWEWNGTDWTQLQPKTSPPARRSAALAYDSSRQRTVLFGGHDKGGLRERHLGVGRHHLGPGQDPERAVGEVHEHGV